MRIGEARIDLDGNIIENAQGQHIVEPKIMQLLRVLSDQPNTVLSREDLITAVWGVDFGGDERLSRAVSLLRKALGDKRGDHKYIETISRKGYRLIADVSHEDGEEIVPPDVSTVPPTVTPIDNIIKSRATPWLAGALSIAVATVMALAVFIFLRPPAAINDLSIEQNLTSGFEKIHFFGHPNAATDAQTYFKGVLKQDADNAAAHAGLSLAYIREFTSSESDPALLKDAKSSALRALEENEHLALSYIAMGWTSEFEGERARALQYLEKADLLDVDNKLTLEARFRMLGVNRDLDGAENLMLRAIALYPQNALFHSYAGELEKRKGDLSAAESFYRKASKLDPGNPWFHSSLAQLLHLQGNTSEAVKTVQVGLEKNESAMLYNNLGTYLFFEGHYELAASAFEKTLRLDGNTHNPLFWANLGDAYRWVSGKEGLSQRNYRRALQIWNEALIAAPRSVELRTRIALYEAKIGTTAIPEGLFRDISEGNNITATQYYRSLVTAEILDHRKEALFFLEKAKTAGYPPNEIKNDPELKSLREDQDYHLIMSE